MISIDRDRISDHNDRGASRANVQLTLARPQGDPPFTGIWRVPLPSIALLHAIALLVALPSPVPASGTCRRSWPTMLTERVLLKADWALMCPVVRVKRRQLG